MMKIFRNIFLLLIITTLIVGCSSTIRFASNSSNKTIISKKSTYKEDYNIDKITDSNNPIIAEAKSWMGTPYCWGGEDKSCTDCSGFVQSVFSKNGFVLPRTAQEQYEVGINISTRNAHITDLVFFGDGNRISHVGIYLGNNYFIHAATSKGVSIASLEEDYFKRKFIGFRRFQ